MKSQTTLKMDYQKLGHYVKHKKNPLYALVATFLAQYSWKMAKMFAFISWMSLKMGHVRSKTRSPGHILEKSCVRSWGQIFHPVLL